MSIIDIIRCTCVQLRKGSDLIINGEAATDEQRQAFVDVDEKGIDSMPKGVVEIFAMPSINEAKPHLEQVDMHFIVVGVDKAKAEVYRQDIIDYAKVNIDHEMSYIELGGIIGDQGMALCFMALGQALGLWNVLTPKTFGFEGGLADQMAGMGYITITTMEMTV